MVGGGVLNGDRAIEDVVGEDQIARGGGGFEDADGSFRDGVVADHVIVAIDKNAGFGGIEDSIAGGAIGIAFEANAVENGIGGGLIVGEFGGVGVNEDADLADGNGIIGDGDAVGLIDKDVSGNGGAGGDGRARRPEGVGDGVAVDNAGGAKSNLNTVLRGAGGGTEAGDNIAANQNLRANFIGGNAIFLKIVDGRGIDGDAGDLPAAALHEDAGAGLAAVETRAEFEIAHRGVTHRAGSVLVSDAEEIRTAAGDPGVRAVDDEAVDGDVGGVGDEKRDGEGGTIKKAGAVLLERRGHEDGAAVSAKRERFLDDHLFDVNTGAYADVIAG